MSIHINNNATSAIRSSLSKNIEGLKKEAIKTATGERILASYEDPSAYVLGHKLKNDSEILSINAQSAIQTAAMIAQANTRIIDLKHQAKGIKSNLLQAYNLFVSDDVRVNNLNPIHMEFNKELDRLVTEFNFAGQKLFSGGIGDTNTDAVKSVLVKDWSNLDRADITLQNINTLISPFTNAAGEAVTISIDPSQNFQVTGGSRSTNAAGQIVITGANLRINNSSYLLENSELTSDSDAAPTRVNSDISFQNVDIILSNDGTEILTLDSKAATIAFSNNPDSLNLSNAEISFVINSDSSSTMTGATSVNSLRGGSIGCSNLKLITGINLAEDTVDINLPNLTLGEVMSSLNIQNFQGDSIPTGFTPITDRESVDYNMQLIEGYLEHIKHEEGKLAATAKVLENIIASHTSSITALDDSTQIVLSNDPAVSLTEKAVKAFNTQMGIQMLQDMLNTLRRLEAIAAG